MPMAVAATLAFSWLPEPRPRPSTLLSASVCVSPVAPSQVLVVAGVVLAGVVLEVFARVVLEVFARVVLEVFAGVVLEVLACASRLVRRGVSAVRLCVQPLVSSEVLA